MAETHDAGGHTAMVSKARADLLAAETGCSGRTPDGVVERIVNMVAHVLREWNDG